MCPGVLIVNAVLVVCMCVTARNFIWMCELSQLEVNRVVAKTPIHFERWTEPSGSAVGISVAEWSSLMSDD